MGREGRKGQKLLGDFENTIKYGKGGTVCSVGFLVVGVWTYSGALNTGKVNGETRGRLREMRVFFPNRSPLSLPAPAAAAAAARVGICRVVFVSMFRENQRWFNE